LSWRRNSYRSIVSDYDTLSEDTTCLAATFNTNEDKTEDSFKMVLTDMQYGNGMEKNASYAMARFCRFC